MEVKLLTIARHCKNLVIRPLKKRQYIECGNNVFFIKGKYVNFKYLETKINLIRYEFKRG